MTTLKIKPSLTEAYPNVWVTTEKKEFKGILPEALIAFPKDEFWDKSLSISTLKPIVVFAEDNQNQDAKPGEATPYCVLGNILSKLTLSTEDIHVDLGCGAGRIVNVLALLNTKQVLGVDVKPECIQQSKNNLKLNPYKHSSVEIIKLDLLEKLPVGSIYWMFNPFGEKTLRRVLQHLSLIDPPPYIIYINPVHDHLFRQNKWDLKQQLKFAGYITHIYSR